MEKAAHKNSNKYKSLFESCPIALWEEDFSKVKKYIDKSKKEADWIIIAS